MRIVTVGTTPAQLLADNAYRTSWAVIMPSTGKEAGNTGRVHVGLGFTPSSNVGAPDQGILLTQNEQTGEERIQAEDRSIHRGAIWAVASIAAQRVWVRETVGILDQVPS